LLVPHLLGVNHRRQWTHKAGIRLQARVQDFVEMLHVYPTMSEALKIVALSFTKDVSKLSCCAE
jgi:mercuric reductase